jgi:hypothetical protein
MTAMTHTGGGVMKPSEPRDERVDGMEAWVTERGLSTFSRFGHSRVQVTMLPCSSMTYSRRPASANIPDVEGPSRSV